MYFISILILLICILLELDSNIEMSEAGRVIILCTSCLSLYAGGLLLSKYKNDTKPMKINLWIFFILYLCLLITLVLYDPLWGRNGINIIDFSNINLREYLNNSCNFIPFKTIISYIKQFNSMYSTRQIIYNLLGNVIALMPLTFFLCLLFKKQKNFKVLLITILMVVIGIEITQLITTSGRFNIDDIILNLFGAISMYFIMNVKIVSNLIGNVFLLEKNELEKKSLIKFSSICFIIILIVSILIIYRRQLYIKNANEHNNRFNPKLEIVNIKKDCTINDSLFYEDILYKYYLKCMDKEQTYILVNKEEKYLIEDILKDKSKYSITISKILSILEINKIEYIREEKNKSIHISYAKGLVKNVIIENQDILSIKHGTFYHNNETIDVDIFLIAKKRGHTNLKIEFKDEKDEKVISIKTYNILIDENLNVTYKENTNQ